MESIALILLFAALAIDIACPKEPTRHAVIMLGISTVLAAVGIFILMPH